MMTGGAPMTQETPLKSTNKPSSRSFFISGNPIIIPHLMAFFPYFLALFLPYGSKHCLRRYKTPPKSISIIAQPYFLRYGTTGSVGLMCVPNPPGADGWIFRRRGTGRRPTSGCCPGAIGSPWPRCGPRLHGQTTGADGGWEKMGQLGGNFWEIPGHWRF